MFTGEIFNTAAWRGPADGDEDSLAGLPGREESTFPPPNQARADGGLPQKEDQSTVTVFTINPPK